MSVGLIVIDMQQCFLMGYKDQGKVDQVIESINETIHKAQAAEVPVMYIEHEFTGLTAGFMRVFNGSKGLRSGPGFSTDERITQVPGDLVCKTVGDAFSEKALREWVSKHDLQQVELCGQDGNFCVQATARGALRLGLEPVINSSAVAAQNWSKWLKAEQTLSREGARLQ